MSERNLIFRINTIGTVEHGVVALWAFVETEDHQRVDEIKCRWQMPTHELGQAFMDTNRHPGGKAAMRWPITHTSGLKAHDDVADFLDKYSERISLYCDEAGQAHYPPFRPWGRFYRDLE